MRVLDLFCGAGGAAMGLHRAWPDAEITGVDNWPQPHYPFTFVQANAMTIPLDGYDFIWASPPCQGYSVATPAAARATHPRLIGLVRARLAITGVPYCIENVGGARGSLRAPTMLCGTMFGLPLFHHRYFELSPATLSLQHPCRHDFKPVLGHRRRGGMLAYSYAKGIHWMNRDELEQAIPPAYSEYIARQFTANS